MSRATSKIAWAITWDASAAKQWRTRRHCFATSEESRMPRQVTSLTLEDARHAIAAGERKAIELKIPYNIAVVDAGGGLIAHDSQSKSHLARQRS